MDPSGPMAAIRPLRTTTVYPASTRSRSMGTTVTCSNATTCPRGAWAALGTTAPASDTAYEQAAWQAFKSWLDANRAILGIDSAELGTPVVSSFEDRRLVQALPEVAGGHRQLVLVDQQRDLGRAEEPGIVGIGAGQGPYSYRAEGP